MNTINIKNLTIGKGTPKSIVSIMAANEAALLREAELYQALDFDILEWRADYFADLANIPAAGAILRETFAHKPLLFTFRTKQEGGQLSISAEDYIALNKAVADSGNMDIIDIELSGAAVKDLTTYAHSKGLLVIISSHDFDKTPTQAEIVRRLQKMQALDADIPKIAVMPRSADDVLTLLAATAEWHKQAKTPFITISMAQLGMISRIAGATFGSCATFGAAHAVSAPGQIAVNELRRFLAVMD